RTLLSLYRLKVISDEEIKLVFDDRIVTTKTDKYGRFQITIDHSPEQRVLREATLGSGERILILEELYPVRINHIKSSTIVISDIDDTLLHSFIRNKIKMFRTLIFKTVEKRRAVKDMLQLLQR